jgi:hypothetical protein
MRYGDDFVFWSVAEVNRQNMGNPGEYVDFICATCGYTEQHPC